MQRDSYTTTIENLIEGCYHEIGHIIAALIFFPNDERLKGMSFSRIDRMHPYRFNTDNDFDSWKFPEQQQACTMLYVCGGVFQQMKSLYNDNKLAMGDIDDEYWRLFFQKKVLPTIEGTEVDYYYLEAYYSKALEHNLIDNPLDLNKAKKEAINLLLPYLKSTKIDKLVAVFIDRIKKQSNKSDNISISIEEIKAYL